MLYVIGRQRITGVGVRARLPAFSSGALCGSSQDGAAAPTPRDTLSSGVWGIQPRGRGRSPRPAYVSRPYARILRQSVLRSIPSVLAAAVRLFR